MTDLFNGAQSLMQVSVIVMLLVLLAMIIDLIAGLYKARQRGELRTSEALRRSLSKFVSYEGGLAIATMVDILIGFTHLYEMFGVRLLIEVPMVTILVGIFLLIVEFMSVREKADKNTKKQQERAIETLSKFMTKEELAAILKAIAARGAVSTELEDKSNE